MKSVKNLLVPFIILVALSLFAAVYFIVDGIAKKKADVNGEGVITVFECDQKDVIKISSTNNETGYTTAVKCSYDGSENVICEFAGDDFIASEKYSQSKLLSFVNAMTRIYSGNKINAEGHMADYGLDNPKFKIVVETNSGTTTIHLGNQSPDNQCCYLCIDGSADVYTVDVSMELYAGLKGIDFLDSLTISINYNEVNSVHFDRKTDGLSLDAKVTVKNNGIAVFDLYSPYVHGTSGYFGNMFDTLSNLLIDEFVEINGTELKDYGLDVPAYHFVFNMTNGTKTEYFFSKPINGYFYGYVSGSNKYFKLSEYVLTGVDIDETVLIDPYICYCYAKDYTTIIGTYKEKTFKFELDVSSENSIVSEESRVSLDGRNAKITDSAGRSYCSLLFESIACIKIGGVEVAEKTKPSSAPELSLTFIDKNYVTTVYEFYPKGTDSYYVFKNGEYMNFYVYATEIFNDGGSDTYSYGYWRAYELLNQAITDNMNGIYDL